MSEWLIAAIILIAALVPCLVVCLFASTASALVALEVAGTLATTTLMVLAEGTHRQPFVDLALILGLLSIIGALTFARMMESHL
jgi:multisubunit Na+/H+ antiporter MnhF subunit